MNRNWRWFIVGYLWCLPMTLAGLVISKFIYKATDYRWYDGVLGCVAAPDSIWGRPNAQTLGWLVIYDTEDSRNLANLRVHEFCHIVQGFTGGLIGFLLSVVGLGLLGHLYLGLILGGFIGGLGFAALYGILFIYLFIKLKTGWYWAYMANPFEIQAYKVQDEYLANPDTKPWGV